MLQFIGGVSVGLTEGLGVVMPVSRGLVGLYVTNNTLQQARTDLNPDTASLSTVHGTPVVSATHTTTKGLVNYFETKALEPSQFTFMVIAKGNSTELTNDKLGVAVGTFESSASVGVNVYFRPTGVIGNAGFADNVGRNTSLNYSANDSFKLLTFRCNSTSLVLRNETDNTENIVSATGTTRTNSGRKIRIGSPYATLGGDTDIFAIAIFDRSLSTEELTKNITFLRQLASDAGITV